MITQHLYSACVSLFQLGMLQGSFGHFYIEPIKDHERSENDEHPHLLYSDDTRPIGSQINERGYCGLTGEGSGFVII